MISKYSSEWPVKYEHEQALLKSSLDDVILDIEHIGSTAIGGISAKPIIDIMIAVQSLEDIASFQLALEKIGYVHKPEMSSTERMFFRKGDPVEFHLSVTERGHTSFWDRQILFRDYLIAHPDSAQEYEKIKIDVARSLSENDQKDLSMSTQYNQAKSPFVQKILQLAQDQ